MERERGNVGVRKRGWYATNHKSESSPQHCERAHGTALESGIY